MWPLREMLKCYRARGWKMTHSNYSEIGTTGQENYIKQKFRYEREIKVFSENQILNSFTRNVKRTVFCLDKVHKKWREQ